VPPTNAEWLTAPVRPRAWTTHLGASGDLIVDVRGGSYAGGMPARKKAARADEHADLWLTPSQLSSWLSVVRMLTRLPWAIDAQLQRDADLSMVEYMSMAMLSEQRDRTLRMSELAERTSVSLSRLSHLIKRLESRGYVRREPDLTDGRFTNAILTDQGMSKLESAAPGHVAHVRRLVVDNLSAERLRRLGQDAERIVQRIDPPAR
jgi:DNA-binding MarR family transcriptional regulator